MAVNNLLIIALIPVVGGFFKQSIVGMSIPFAGTVRVGFGHECLFPIILQESISIWENRRERTDQAEYGIPGIEWVVLLTGAIITIIFTYFFTTSLFKTQLFMTGLITLIISINLV